MMRVSQAQERVARWRALRSVRSEMADFLGRLEPERWCYFPNPGNAGDAMIHAGTLAAFERASLSWEVVGAGDDVADRSVVVGGGGNLVPRYDHMSSAIHGFLDTRPSRLVVLPHGVRDHVDVLERLREQDVVVVRDQVAHRHVQAHTRASVRLGHDMAFHLDARRMLRDQRLAREGAALLDRRLSEAGLSVSELSRRDTVHLMRRDGERLVDIGSDFDPSEKLMSGTVTDLSAVDVWAMLACVVSCRAVVTDRLHVAIAAALLGVATELHPNSYDKNVAVFETSLSLFPGITFAGEWRSGAQ